jgi:hypothetical protein
MEGSVGFVVAVEAQRPQGDGSVPAAGVQLAGSRADEVLEAALVGRVDVFVRRLQPEDAGRPLRQDGLQALENGLQLGVGQQAHAGDGLGVGLGTADVLQEHALVHGDAGVELRHQRVRGPREAPAPQPAAFVGLGPLGHMGFRHAACVCVCV